MCGIYATILNGGSPGRCLEKLNKLNHRGPDNQSHCVEDDVFLGHTRLSIIDTGTQANQPFRDDNHVLIYNGEIYNYLELKDQYLKDISFKTHSDTEVLFNLLIKFGVKIIKELNGMFALVFYCKDENTLIAARDTMGVKPLYYIKNGDSLEISSEIKSLDFNVDINRVKQFISLRTYQNGYLPYDNVREFPMGCYAVYNISDHEFTVEEYNKIEDIPNRDTYAKNKDKGFGANMRLLEELIQKSVEIHLRSDVKIGALCSGGIDSSLISAIAVKYNPDLELYHAGVEGPGGEEKYAEIVSRHINKNINYIKVSTDNYWQVFPYLTYISDLPIYHPNDVSLHYVAEKAHGDGVKALLSGEGADELFGGYTWLQNLIRRKKIFDIYDKFPILNKIMRRALFTFTKNGLNAVTSESYKNFMPLGLGYNDFNAELNAKTSSFTANDFNNWRQWQRHLGLYKNFDRDEGCLAMSIMLNNLYGHLSSILHRTDRILMANSIEGRVPFLENEIIKFALNLPYDHKIKGMEGKYILKKAAEKFLPAEIVYRKKMGFPVPWGNYTGKIEKIFEKGFVQETTGLSLNDLKLFYQDDIYLKFTFISLEVWGRIFVNHQDYKSITIE